MNHELTAEMIALRAEHDARLEGLTSIWVEKERKQHAAAMRRLNQEQD